MSLETGAGVPVEGDAIRGPGNGQSAAGRRLEVRLEDGAVLGGLKRMGELKVHSSLLRTNGHDVGGTGSSQYLGRGEFINRFLYHSFLRNSNNHPATPNGIRVAWKDD